MKKILILLLCQFGLTIFSFAQVAGNANYTHQKTYLNNNLQPTIYTNNPNQIVIRAKGIYNETDTRKIAYFSITQLGKDIDEVNTRMDNRIKDVEEKVKANLRDVKFFVDMISFVPMYEYEVTKRLFSKTSYNEVPLGFELKKNLHISFSNHEDLDEIIAICADNEIYDLVKVEYISMNLEKVQDSLRDKAYEVLQKKIKFHEKLTGLDFSKKKKIVNEGFNSVFPKDRYKTYTAFSSENVHFRRRSVVNNAQKSRTQYYEPISSNGQHFVINPEVLEPAIQTVYELQIVIDLREPLKEVTPPTKEYYYMNGNGDFKKLPIQK